MSFTNEQFVELVQSFLEELRPVTPVKCGLGRTEVAGKPVKEYLFIAMNVERGPQTEVRFSKTELVGLSEAHIKVFLTGKLAAIGVTIAEVRERAANVTGETADEFDGAATPEELAQLAAMATRRNINAPGQQQAAARVEQQLKADPANVTPADLAALGKAVDDTK